MKCRGCKTENNFEVILDLGKQAWCNDFLEKHQVGKEKKYPLKLVYCKACDLLQLTYTVPKETMFLQHDYVSGTTRTLRDHFNQLAEENVKQFGLSGKDMILDIGGNDGTQLFQYKLKGLENVLNVESATNIAKMSEEIGIPTINAFFNEELVYKRFKPGTISLINASGVFFHLEELDSVIRAIKYLLLGEGIFIVQFMYAPQMIRNKTFDMIYHEHLLYYTLKSLENLLRPYGLEVFDAYESDIHSGSVIAKISHNTSKEAASKTQRYLDLKARDDQFKMEDFIAFGKEIESKKGELRKFLKKLKRQGKTIYAYGAPAKGNTLLQYFNIDDTLITKVVEVNPLKIGKFTPITHLPIIKETNLDVPDYYLLLSHNFQTEILERNKELIDKGLKFISPFPNPYTIESKYVN